MGRDGLTGFLSIVPSETDRKNVTRSDRCLERRHDAARGRGSVRGFSIAALHPSRAVEYRRHRRVVIRAAAAAAPGPDACRQGSARLVDAHARGILGRSGKC